METQIIVNLLYNIDNRNSKFATKNVKKMLLILNQKASIHPQIESNF